MASEEDILLKALHGDKEEVLKKQVESIEEEISERKKIDSDMVESIEKEKGKLEVELGNLKRPFVPGFGDSVAGEISSEKKDKRKDVMTIEKEKLGLSKEEREEWRDCWKDVQNLKKEEREVEQGLLKIEKKRERYSEFADD